jgi:predicted permease
LQSNPEEKMINYFFIALSATILLVIFILAVLMQKKGKKMTPRTGLAFGFIISGTIFGGNQLVGYGLIGVGLAIAVADIIIKLKKK